MYTRILFVHENDAVLKNLQLMLFPQHLMWDMAFANNGKEALDMMETDPFSIIMTGVQLQDMSGAQLLNIVQQTYPSALRFVLTSPSERLITRAIIPAHRYLEYPCQMESIITAVERALSLRNRLADEQLKTLVSQIKILPSLPDLYMKIMLELRSPEYSLASIGKIISNDVGMSAKVLNLVNSAYFALPQRVTSPSLAVNLLGVDIIRSMILMSDVFTQFDRIRSLAPQFDFEGQQQHCFQVANYARTIAKYEGVHQTVSDSYFIAGLFHDIGKLLLVANMPQKCVEAELLHKTTDMTLPQAERMILGASHAEIGAYLLCLWGFADPIVEACAYHHTPEIPEESAISPVRVVSAADYIAHLTDPGCLADQALDPHIEPKIDYWTDICQDTMDLMLA